MGTMTEKRVEVVELMKGDSSWCLGSKKRSGQSSGPGEGVKMLRAGGDGKTNGVEVIMNE